MNDNSLDSDELPLILGYHEAMKKAKKLTKQQIDNMFDTPAGRKKLAEMMVIPIRRMIEMSIISGIKPFHTYWVLKHSAKGRTLRTIRRKDLRKWDGGKDGWGFDYILWKKFWGKTYDILASVKIVKKRAASKRVRHGG